jgi:hypothetical protein
VSQALDVSGAGKEAQDSAPALVESIERLFEQQPLERQEIYVALRQLNNLLNPPEDEMNPTLRQFYREVESCRSDIEEMIDKAKSALGKADGARKTEGPDQNMLANAQAALRKAERLRQSVDKLEREGPAAHQRRDRKTWATTFDMLMSVAVQARERPRFEMPPTILGKLLAGHHVMREIDRLQEWAGGREANGGLKDWQGEINRIQRGLNEVLSDLEAISDVLQDDQGNAQIRLIFARKLQPLSRAIDELGAVIRTTN